jgi:uncharacterized protein (TIGR03000 family)
MTRLISFIGGATLAVATLLVAGPAANAQHRGGMSGGAYHGGGAYRGGGYGYGGYGYRGYGYGGYGYGYPGFGLTIGLGGLGYGGYYGDYGYAPGYYNYAPTYAVPPAYVPGYGVQTQSAYTPSADTARLVIRTPANAQVWVDNYQSTQTGPVRELTTPGGLEPGKTYHYTIKAQWTDNGKPVVQERKVDFLAGQMSMVDFTQPATTTPNQIPVPPTLNPVPQTPPATTPPVTQPG